MESKTKQEIAIENVQSKYPSMIVKCYGKYVIIAHDELDYQFKKSKIINGETFGFYTVESAQVLHPWPKSPAKTTFLEKCGCLAIMVIPVAIVIWIFDLIFG